jgi:hypothetical protein
VKFIHYAFVHLNEFYYFFLITEANSVPLLDVKFIYSKNVSTKRLQELDNLEMGNVGSGKRLRP